MDSSPKVRVFSPVAVGVYGLVLAFPCSLSLAIRNWRALGRRDRIRPHLIGGIVVSVVFAVTAFLLPMRILKGVGVAANMAAFFYFRDRLRIDLESFAGANPGIEVQTRPWYAGLGWALLGLLLFLILCLAVGAVMGALGVPME